MKISNERGGIAVAVIGDVVLLILLICSAGFGYWAFSGRQDYKNNVDQKIATAVADAQAKQKVQLANDFNEQQKSPNKVYAGPLTYGTVSFSYPKTWSAYVDSSNPAEPINGFFHPDIVPGAQSSTAFGLRVELVSSDYSTVIQQMSSSITQHKLTANAYVPPRMVNAANVTPGTRFDGAISRDSSGHDQLGSMVVLKVRDKTLKIYTESDSFKSDFDNIVLATLTYIP